jgi:hypothetical protein
MKNERRGDRAAPTGWSSRSLYPGARRGARRRSLKSGKRWPRGGWCPTLPKRVEFLATELVAGVGAHTPDVAPVSADPALCSPPRSRPRPDRDRDRRYQGPPNGTRARGEGRPGMEQRLVLDGTKDRIFSPTWESEGADVAEREERQSMICLDSRSGRSQAHVHRVRRRREARRWDARTALSEDSQSLPIIND